MSPRIGYDGEELAHVTVRIRKSLHEQLLEEARARDVSVSRLVNSAIERHLAALPPVDPPPRQPPPVPPAPISEP